MFQRMLPLVALQSYEPGAIDAHVASAYPRLMDRLFAGLSALPARDAVEVHYDDLLHDPLETVARIYRELDLDGFPRARPKIAQFLMQQPVAAAARP